MQLFLVQVDVNVNGKDKDGQSPFMSAAENRHSEVMQLFLGWGDVDVNSKDEGLQFLLLYATENGHLKIVQKTSKGVNWHVESSYNTFPGMSNGLLWVW